MEIIDTHCHKLTLRLKNNAPLKNSRDILYVGQFRMPQRAGITKNLLANRRSSSPEPAYIPAEPGGIPDITCNI